MTKAFIDIVAADSHEPEVVRGVLGDLYRRGILADTELQDDDQGYRQLVLNPLNLAATHRSIRNIKLHDLVEALTDLVPAALSWNWHELIPGGVGFIVTLFKATGIPLEPNDGIVIFAMWRPNQKTSVALSVPEIASASKQTETDVTASLLGLKARRLVTQEGDAWRLADSVSVKF